MLGHGGAREDRTVPIGAPDEPLGRIELGVRPGTAIDELHGRPPPALLVIEKAGPGRHQPVVAGTVTVRGVLPVGGDRTGDEPGIECNEGVVVDAEPRRSSPTRSCRRRHRMSGPAASNCRLPSSLCRSRRALRLPRFQTRYPVCCAKGSPGGDSIRMTSAPLSARNMVVMGPAMPQDRSRTRRSSNAPAIRLHPFTLRWVTIVLTMSQHREARWICLLNWHFCAAHRVHDRLDAGQRIRSRVATSGCSGSPRVPARATQVEQIGTGALHAPHRLGIRS